MSPAARGHQCRLHAARDEVASTRYAQPVRFVTNPGSNLSDEEVREFDLFLTPQQIVVDGVYHDMRTKAPHATVDAWVKTAKEHPFVLGSSAAECSDYFRQIAGRDKGIVMLTTSRQLIGTYTAAVAAARSFAALHPDVNIDVVDTRSTDLGAGMTVLFAAEAARAGKPQREVVALADRFAAAGKVMFHIPSLDYIVKGGRASFLRAWVADLLRVTPLLSFVNGELKAVGRVARSADPVVAIRDAIVQDVPAGRAVWLAVLNGGTPDAARLADLLRRTYVVEREFVRPLSASIYLHGGPRCMGAAVYPTDALPWRPEPKPA